MQRHAELKRSIYMYFMQYMEHHAELMVSQCKLISAEFKDPVFAKQSHNARFQSYKTSVLGLFSRKLGL